MNKDEALRLALEFIPSISPAFICEASHHKKHEQHASNEPCPHVAKQKQVYEAIKAALEAKDEPVAWNAGIPSLYPKMKEGETISVEYVELTPPQRKPLTDEEIEYAFKTNSVMVDNGNAYMVAGLRAVNIARAIEAKLKEKNT